MSKPVVLQGGHFTDHRGTISYINDFHFEGVTRFYNIHHPTTDIIRAWQGHVQESKYYYPVKGTWLIAWVKMELDKPEEEWKAEHIILKASESNMIYLPSGFANGFRALEPDSMITGFSIPGEKEETILRWVPEKWFDWKMYDVNERSDLSDKS